MRKFLIVDRLNSNQIEQLRNLFKQMWWAKERGADEIAVMLKNSRSFGLVESDTQNLVGYARVLTDEIKYAFIFDLMVIESHRKKRLGKMLMESILNHPCLKNVKHFELTCAPDMIAFYKKFGFSENYGGEVRPMRCSREEIFVA